MSKVQDEQTKLTATWLNGVSVAATVAGAIAPLAAAFYGVSGAGLARLYLGIGALLWLSVGIGIHLCARRVLARLTP